MQMSRGPSAAVLVSFAGVAAASLLFHQLRSRQLRSPISNKRKIVITGGCGNLGTKIATFLLETYGSEVVVVLIEHPLYIRREAIPKGVSQLVELDLGHPSCVPTLRETLKGADAVVHFSAVNPYPNADWAECAGSMDHSFNLLLAAKKEKVRRFVLASSNHVMGGYKDVDVDVAGRANLNLEEEGARPRKVTPRMPPKVGTRVKTAAVSGDAVAYGAAKLAAERLCACVAAAAEAEAMAGTPSTNGKPATSFVVLRIGWCQPGTNSPSTLSAEGAPPEFLSTNTPAAAATADDQSGRVDEAWFKSMWLSNSDFLAYMDAALRIPSATLNERTQAERGPLSAPKTSNFVVVNAMSNNTGMKWCLADTERILGVTALDDSSK